MEWMQGLGTELGLGNTLLLVALSVSSFFVRREVKKLVSRVDEMWAEHQYRKRKDASGQHEVDNKELIALMVADALKEKDEE